MRTLHDRCNLAAPLAAALLLQALVGCDSLLGQWRAPDFELTDLKGRTVTLTQLRGKVVPLNFWATWAPPCRLTLPHLSWLKWKFGGEDFTVLGITVGEKAAQVKRFIRTNPVNFTVLIGDGSVVKDYFREGDLKLPLTLLVDERGRVVERFVGYQTAKDLRLAVEEAITRLKKSKGVDRA